MTWIRTHGMEALIIDQSTLPPMETKLPQWAVFPLPDNYAVRYIIGEPYRNPTDIYTQTVSLV